MSWGAFGNSARRLLCVWTSGGREAEVGREKEMALVPDEGALLPVRVWAQRCLSPSLLSPQTAAQRCERIKNNRGRGGREEPGAHFTP